MKWPGGERYHMATDADRMVPVASLDDLDETHRYVLVASSQVPRVDEQYAVARNFTSPPSNLGKGNVTLLRRT